MRCLNPRCPRELADDWAFCDLCGKDNRPPRLRTSVVEDEHLAPTGEFCVRCGVSILDLDDSEDGDENRLRVVGGWAALVVGGLSLALSAALRSASHTKAGDGAGSVSLAFMAARYGSYLFAAGVILLLVTPAVRRRRR